MNPFSIKKPSLWLFLIPSALFIQLGYSYYLSVFIFSFLFLLLVPKLPRLHTSAVLLTVLAASAFLLKATVSAFGGEEMREILLPMREMLCFVGLIIGSLKIRDDNISPLALQKLALSCLTIIASLIIYQYFVLGKGSYFGLPVSWYVKNQGTLAGVDGALLYHTRIRPTAFYGEPSYAGFIILSFLAIVLRSGENQSYKLAAIVIAYTTVFFLQSVACYISIIVYTMIWVNWCSSGYIQKNKFFILFFGITVSIFFVLLSNEFASRYSTIISQNDFSFANRFVDPLRLLDRGFAKGDIFGVTTNEIYSFFGWNIEGSLFNNGLIWIIVYYGLLSIPIFFSLVRHTGIGLGLVYVLMSMNFNGDFFSYDKAVVMSMVLGVFLRSRRTARMVSAGTRNAEF